MKYRESGMPEEKMWKTFFNPAQILNHLDVGKEWASNAGFFLEKQVDLPPHHYGFVFIKK
ncbi:MAG: hypothetical protein K0S61_4958 [Anaerocolumna sp.]|jgi:hypothetical protein|nr:hypothetical protein [Anaerocolumna sp.]